MNRFAALIMVVLAVPFLTAAVVLSDWQQQLEFQLKKEQGCDVVGLSSIKLRVINGKETIAARAHCSDKRAFDVTRDGPDQPFQIRECSTYSC